MDAPDQPILIVTSCTSRKAAAASEKHRLLRAMEMYTGEQHAHVRTGVRLLRECLGSRAVSVVIVSAGYGVVAEEQMIAPYDATFSRMRSSDLRERARQLGIPSAVREAAHRKRLVIFLLGANYLRALEPPIRADPGQRFLFLAKPSEFRHLIAPQVVVVPAGEDTRARVGSNMIALKGAMFEYFARGVAAEGAGVIERVCADSTPAAFQRALLRGLDAR